MKNSILGIDIAKKKFDVILLTDDKPKHKIFSNNKPGFNKLLIWIKSNGAKELHACMESTGVYGESLTTFLYEQGYKVSVVNPCRIKLFAMSSMIRTKTDKVDALIIAKFCKSQNPSLWNPPSKEEKELKELYRCLKSLQKDRTKIINRLEKFENKRSPVTKVWQKTLSFMEDNIKKVEQKIKDLLDKHPPLKKKHDLLKTIPGIADNTATSILSELPNIDRFNNARELAAFAGLNPYQKQSGSSLFKKGRISKIGCSSLRRDLYFPALIAKRYNLIIANFCNNLEEKGKCPMVIIVAAMRKLLHIIFGILKSGKPFDENFIQKKV